jgi:anion-transporting  ArsA/GET3 family ATPase
MAQSSERIFLILDALKKLCEAEPKMEMHQLMDYLDRLEEAATFRKDLSNAKWLKIINKQSGTDLKEFLREKEESEARTKRMFEELDRRNAERKAKELNNNPMESKFPGLAFLAEKS